MYTLKSIAQRGTLFGAAAALVVAAVIPGVSVLADSLNPLTERSLLLSSSAPGFMDSDGAGNSESNPNAWNDPDGDGPLPGTPGAPGEYYALPGSGPNGKKSGETFSFRVSTNSSAAPAGTGEPVKAFSLQYCTTAAGNCQAPGNNGGDSRDGVKATSAYAAANTYDGSGVLTNNSEGREANDLAHPEKRSDFDVVTDGTTPWVEDTIATVPGTPGTYRVLVNGVQNSGWSMSTKNAEDLSHSGPMTGKNNYIMLTKTAGAEPVFNDKIEVKFTPNTKNYITNPGAGSFFVKINTYKNFTAGPPVTLAAGDIIDGGVTVANVMTDSIHITTKVLETMSFSVGIQNPDQQSLLGTGTIGDQASWDGTHGTCDAMNAINGNRLDLGNPNAESSLETGKAWDVHSFWRLSSNSSGGATVYYSGDTLRNTVGDRIKPVGVTETVSKPGTEQFGLGFVPIAAGDLSDTFAKMVADDLADGSLSHKEPLITPLVMNTSYDEASGAIGEAGSPGVTATAKFAFDSNSKSVPAVIAANNNAVLTCATAKMRYVGNIAADTPAGVYTTKINYLAAPQY